MDLRLSVPAALLLLAACSSPDEVAEKTGVDRSQQSSANASATSSAGARGKAVSVKEDNDLYSYAFSYPAQVGAYPELANTLQAQADKGKAELVAQAREGQADAKANGYPFNPHSLLTEWQVVADLPGYVSLSNNFATYSGGAHGMYGLQSLVWDNQARVAMDGVELFRSADDLEAAMGPSLCDALNAERRKKRGPDYPSSPPGSDYGFDSCQHLKDATVLVGSSNGKTFDRITVWYGPYVAGPYAEGAYELDFPMTTAMLEAVKPAYRGAFSAKK